MAPGLRYAACALILFVASVGCGEAKLGEIGLTSTQAKKVLERLPFHFEFRHIRSPLGATGALAGVMSGPKQTSVAFSLTLGESTVPIPVPESGVGNAVEVKSARFILT